MSRGLRAGSLFCLALLAGCALHQPPGPAKTAALPAFASAHEATLSAQACRPLVTPQTQQALRQLTAQNLALQAAWARFRQARAQAEQIRAGQRASVQLTLESQRSKTRLPELGPIAPDAAFIQERHQISLGADYELDLWSRLRGLTDAADLRARAQQADARTMAMSLSAQLLESWFDAVFEAQQRGLLQDQADLSQKLLDILKLRFTRGQGSALDPLQQKQQLEALQASLALNQAQLEISKNQIAVLLGEDPTTDAVQRMLPTAQPLPALSALDGELSLSASLLARRPDLRAAFQQMQAADAELAASVAQRLPAVRLSMAIFDQGPSLRGLLDTLLWQIGASVTQTVYSGGRIAAQIEGAEAVLDESFLQYRQALLNALQELADARSAERQEMQRIGHLVSQRDIAEDSYELVRKQYLRGSVDFLRVLNAQQSLIEVQQDLLRAQRQRLSHRIQFCRALGGSWLPGAT